MTLLAIQLPSRDRLGARAGAHKAQPGLRLPTEWAFVLSSDGRVVTQVGQAAAALLPKADHTVLVLAEADVSWHLIDIPRAPAARLRAALAGVMEEALLDDDDGTLHFALAADAAPGRRGWVGVTDGRRLAAALAALEGAGLTIERVVPAAAPLPVGASPAATRGHFHIGGDVEGATVAEDDHPWLTLANPDGVLCVRLAGGLARALLPSEMLADSVLDSVRDGQWSASPAAASAAERLLGRPVPLLGEAGRTLEAARCPINLRQFDLAARHRGTRALNEGARRFFSADWRPVRFGVAALVLLQIVGLNAYAWQQGQALESKRVAMTVLLKTAHPGVRAVLDAPLQMQRETDRLRAAAGRAGAADLEALLAAAAAAWPDGVGPTQTLRFETGSLTLAAPGWAEPQVQQFRERIRANGYGADFAEGRVVVTRAGSKGAL